MYSALNLNDLYSITLYNSNPSDTWIVESLTVSLASGAFFQFGFDAYISGTPVTLQAPLQLNAVTAAKGATGSAVYVTFTNTNTNINGSFLLFPKATNGEVISTTVVGVNEVVDATSWTLQLGTFSSTGWNATSLSFTKNGVVAPFKPIFVLPQDAVVTATRL